MMRHRDVRNLLYDYVQTEMDPLLKDEIGVMDRKGDATRREAASHRLVRSFRRSPAARIPEPGTR